MGYTPLRCVRDSVYAFNSLIEQHNSFMHYMLYLIYIACTCMHVHSLCTHIYSAYICTYMYSCIKFSIHMCMYKYYVSGCVGEYIICYQPIPFLSSLVTRPPLPGVLCLWLGHAHIHRVRGRWFFNTFHICLMTSPWNSFKCCVDNYTANTGYAAYTEGVLMVPVIW